MGRAGFRVFSCTAGYAFIASHTVLYKTTQHQLTPPSSNGPASNPSK